MFHRSISTAFIVAASIVIAAIASPAFASKEKFVRDKPHVNVGNIGSSGEDGVSNIGSSGMDGIPVRLEGADGSQTTTTNENGDFWFENLPPGAKKLFIGSLSYGDYPPDPVKLTINHGAYPQGPKSSKPKEIVVVGSKDDGDDSGGQRTVQTEILSMDLSGKASDKEILSIDSAEGNEGKPKPKPKPGPGTTVQTEILSMSLSGDDPEPIYIEIVSMDGGPTRGTEIVDVPHPQNHPDSFFDVFFEVEVSTTPDSFFDIFVDVGESSISGTVQYMAPEVTKSPEKPDIPDRPEVIERPERPDRPDAGGR